MKILILIPSITSYYTFLVEITNKLIKEKNNFHLATSPKHLKNINCYNEVVNGTYHPIFFARGMNPIQHIKAAIKLRKLVHDLKPDIIHAHFMSSIFAMALAKTKDFPTTIATYHGLNSPLFKGWRNKLFQLLEQYCISRTTSTWFLNKEDALFFEKKKNQINTHTSLGIGCPTAEFNPNQFSEEFKKSLKLKLGISNDDFIYIYIGRHVMHKGFASTARAFMKLNEINSNCKLLLVGIRDNLHPTGLTKKEEVKFFALDNVIQVGWQKEVQPYLAISQVMVFPSRREGVPCCLMEALTMSVPVITLNSRGCRDVVRHEIDGLVLNNDSPNTVLEAMERLFNNPRERNNYAHQAHKDSNRFDREHYVKEQLSIYKMLLIIRI